MAAAYHPIICALHPDTAVRTAHNGQNQPQDAVYAAVFSSEVPGAAGANNFRAALHLDYEHCGCWIWPELDAAFFLNHKLSLFSTL